MSRRLELISARTQGVIATVSADDLRETYHHPWSDEVRRLLDRASDLRRVREHIVAGDLERDAAALIRLEHERRAVARCAARLGLVRDEIVGGWRTAEDAAVTLCHERAK